MFRKDNILIIFIVFFIVWVISSVHFYLSINWQTVSPNRTAKYLNYKYRYARQVRAWCANKTRARYSRCDDRVLMNQYISFARRVATTPKTTQNGQADDEERPPERASSCTHGFVWIYMHRDTHTHNVYLFVYTDIGKSFTRRTINAAREWLMAMCLWLRGCDVCAIARVSKNTKVGRSVGLGQITHTMLCARCTYKSHYDFAPPNSCVCVCRLNFLICERHAENDFGPL